MSSTKILVVEDEVITGRVISEELTILGYIVSDLAHSDEEVFASVSKNKPDLVLMDINLKGSKQDGIAIATILREVFHLPVIYLTAHTDDATLERAKNSDPYGYLVKPFDGSDLHTAIEIAIYKHCMESQVAEREERFRQLAENIKDVFFLHSIDFKEVIYISPAFESIWGYAREDCYQNPLLWIELVHPEDLERMQLSSALVTQAEQMMEYRIIRPDGTIRWLRTRAFPVKNKAGEVYRIAGVTEDVSDRKSLEIALQNSETQFRSIFEQVPVGIAYINSQGEFQRVNQRFCDILRFTEKELMQLTVQSITHPEDLEENLRNLQRLDSGEISSFCIEKRYIRKDRTIVWVSLTGSIFHDTQKNEIFYIGAITDISDRKQAEDSLTLQLQREKLITEVTQQIRQSLELDEILSETVAKVKHVLQADRVSIFRLYPDGRGKIIQEKVDPKYPSYLDLTWLNEYFEPGCFAYYCQGQPRIISDVTMDEWGTCLEELMQSMGVKSKIVAPILQHSQRNRARHQESKYGDLWGLLIAHACTTDRTWQGSDAELLQQIANQLAIAIQQAQFYAQVKDELADRIKIEAKLRKSEANLAKAEKLAHLGNWEYDLTTGKIIWSEELFQIWGREPSLGEPTYTELLQIVHPSQRKEFDATVTRAIQSGGSYEMDLQILHPDGSIRYICSRGSTILDEAGRRIALFGATHDITERKLAEIELKLAKEELESKVRERTSELMAANFSLQMEIEEHKRTEAALSQSEVQHLALLNAIPDLIFRLNRKGDFIDFKARREHLVMEPQAIKGSNIADSPLPSDAIAQIVKAIDRALHTGNLQTVEYSLELLDGQIHHFESRILASGKDEVVAFVRDISDRKAVEVSQLALQREQELSRLQRNFFSMISHEFRTPLGVIKMSAQLIEHNGSQILDEKTRRSLARIQSSISYITSLLDDMITINKAEASQLEVNPQVINVVDFCQNLVDELQLESPPRIAIVSQSAQNQKAYFDPKLLRFILSNLLSNAIKYSEPTTQIDFEIDHSDNTLVFRIQDRGIGIPLEEQTHIFEPFYRATNADAIAGSGLGLTVVKKCAKVHGGTVTFTSKVGVGTIFVVTIPSQLPLLDL
ncbi:PAS domain S-box protein [Tumidithrix elongata RA019]|uniref:histidine kinase n=1 Tax=Tumidithrix elongata BACA0141 TaxID=2716417 RepID=A0AAW9PWN0_9CYAN|nr:PAS domain S-box protein [Tumidithrix elongata RA019]